MAYIRSTSNPECLFIFGSRAGVEIYAGRHQKNGSYLIPQETWNALCYKSVDEGLDYEGVEVDGYYVRETWVLDAVTNINKPKIALGYKDQWELTMWSVTWDAITRRYELEWYAKNVYSFRAKLARGWRKITRR